MDTPRKIIVGYDLGDEVSQISCYSYKTFEPETISPNENDEYYPIPTVLCLKKDTRLWHYGAEALACAEAGEGILVDHLLDRVKNKSELQIMGQCISAVALLEKFFRRTLSLVKNYFPTEPITQMVITIRDTEPSLVEGIYQALDLLGIEKDRAVVTSYSRAYLYYALYQDKSIWMNDVGLFDFSEAGLFYYQISINRRMKPYIAVVNKRDFTNTLNYSMLTNKSIDIGYTFENIANTALYKQLISGLYFTGSGFEQGWMEGVLKNLCTGRRVFLGQNLYTRGACYGAKELSGDQKLEDYILLNNELIQVSVSLRVYSDARYKEALLTEAAKAWYEIDQSIEVIPEDTNEIEIVFKNIITKDILREKLMVDYPKRPSKMTRLKVTLTFQDKSTAMIAVRDLGFGEFYPSSGREWEFMIEL